LAANSLGNLLQAYLGVEEIYGDTEQEDHYEEGEELMQNILASSSTTVESPCTHQHVSGKVVPGVDHRENAERSPCGYEYQSTLSGRSERVLKVDRRLTE
jgi:hypothetical protein